MARETPRMVPWYKNVSLRREVREGKPCQGRRSRICLPEEARVEIIDLIESIQVPQVTAAVKAYLRSEYDADTLMNELAVAILKHDSGHFERYSTNSNIAGNTIRVTA